MSGESIRQRLGRLVLSSHPGVRFRWLPYLLWTAHLASDAWVWRLFWGCHCLGWMKPTWRKPVRLSRQLQRQLAWKGTLTFVAAVLLAAITWPGPCHAEDCYTPDALLAQAVLKYKWRTHSEFRPGEEGELFLRAQGQGSCTQTPDGVADTFRRLEERVQEQAMERALERVLEARRAAARRRRAR